MGSRRRRCRHQRRLAVWPVSTVACDGALVRRRGRRGQRRGTCEKWPKPCHCCRVFGGMTPRSTGRLHRLGCNRPRRRRLRLPRTFVAYWVLGRVPCAFSRHPDSWVVLPFVPPNPGSRIRATITEHAATSHGRMGFHVTGPNRSAKNWLNASW